MTKSGFTSVMVKPALYSSWHFPYMSDGVYLWFLLQNEITITAHNTQATGQPGMQRAKMKNPPLGQTGNRTRSFYPAALVDQTGDRNTVHPGIGRTEYNGNMQDARRCSFEFRFSDCKSGKNSDVVSRPAKNSYGFFSRSRSECPDFFPTFV